MFGKNEIVGKKYFKDAKSNQLFVTSMFMTLQGEGPFRGRPAFFIRLAKCNLACGFCFVGNTYVSMSNGKHKKIKDIKIGDEVATWDNGIWTKKKVTNKFISETSKILKLEFSAGKKVYTTPEHPFYVKDKGWVEAKDILDGDVVLHLPNSERMKMGNPMFREEISKKVAESQKGRPGYLNIAWNDPKFREAHLKRMRENNPNFNPETAIKGFLSRTDLKKSSTEKEYEKIVEGLPVKFVGHGDLIVNYLAPDFVVEGQNKVIEVWDSDQTEYLGRDEKWQETRRERLREGGYETLFLPFNGKTNRDEVYRKTVEFISNGYTLRSKTLIEKPVKGSGSNGKTWIRLAGSLDGDVTVYNIEVEDTHNYVANGLLVHNCDTFFDDGDWLTFDQIETRIEETIEKFYLDKGWDRPDWTRHDKKHGIQKEMVLVMTGGEPMLQDNMGPFLDGMTSVFQDLQIESNGTQDTQIPWETTLVISPKCSEKKGKAVKYLEPNKNVLERADCLKFVMEANPDSPYSSIPEWALKWKEKTGKDIYVSPMNIYNTEPQASKQLRSKKNKISIEERSTVDEVISFWTPGLLNMEENQKNHEYAAAYAIRHGLIFQVQIHLLASVA